MQREGEGADWRAGNGGGGGGGEVTPPESPRMNNGRSRMPATHNSRAAARFSETPRMLTEIGHGKWVQDAVQWMWGGGGRARKRNRENPPAMMCLYNGQRDNLINSTVFYTRLSGPNGTRVSSACMDSCCPCMHGQLLSMHALCLFD